MCFVVADHEQCLVCGFPVVCHDTVLILKDRKQIAVYDSFAISRILTQRKQAAVASDKTDSTDDTDSTVAEPTVHRTRKGGDSQ